MNVVQSGTTSVVYDRVRMILAIKGTLCELETACGKSESERSRISTADHAPAEMVVKIKSCQIEYADISKFPIRAVYELLTVRLPRSWAAFLSE